MVGVIHSLGLFGIWALGLSRRIVSVSWMDVAESLVHMSLECFYILSPLALNSSLSDIVTHCLLNLK